MESLLFAAFRVFLCEYSSGHMSFPPIYRFFLVKFEDLFSDYSSVNCFLFCFNQVSVDADGRLNESRAT